MYTTADVHKGLSSVPKKLPMDFMYFEDGGKLFHEICKQPAYYMYRNDVAVVSKCAANTGDQLKNVTTLVEFGSGLAHKSYPFIEAMTGLKQFIPVDIDEAVLVTAETELNEKFPTLEVTPFVGDLFNRIPLPAGPKLGLIAGNLVTVYEDPEVVTMLRSCLDSLGKDSSLMITFDSNQNPDTVMPCYINKPCYEFVLNALRTLNARFGGDADLNNFHAHAQWNTKRTCVEYSLKSNSQQMMKVDNRLYSVGEGERIEIVFMIRRSVEAMKKLVHAAGAMVKASFFDPDHYICLLWLERKHTSA